MVICYIVALLGGMNRMELSYVANSMYLGNLINAKAD